MRVTTVSVVDSIRVTYTVNHSDACDSTRILNAADSTLVKKLTNPEDSTVVIGGLTQGTTYHWIVLVDSADVQSLPDSLQFTTADIDMPQFTMVSSKHNSITINIIHSLVGGDSLIVVTAPDSVAVVKVITPVDTTGNYTITGLTPFTQYIWRLKADSANAVRSSLPDTISTKRMNMESIWFTNINLDEKGKIMYRWDSWKDDNLKFDYITLEGATDSDSTIWYEAAPHTSINGFAWGHADSTKFVLRIYAGYPFSDETKYWQTLQDTLLVSSPGPFDTGSLDMSPNGWFYIKAVGKTDNAGGDTSDSTYFKLRLNRSR